MKTANNDAKLSRIVNLDFLRGVVIILAMQQHFAFYLNVWFVSYFRDFEALSTTYKSLLPLMNNNLPTDYYNHLMAIIFTPWVSQIYLCLAAFNLSKRDQVSFKSVFKNKMKIFILIFFIFWLENFFVAPNTGEAISIYPIMLWMFVLGFLAILYRFFGVRGIASLGIISLLGFLLPIDQVSDGFQNIIRLNIHPSFEYDARIEYFILSGVVGFLLGYCFYHKPLESFKKSTQIIMLLSATYAIFFLMLGDSFIVYPENVLSNEHFYAKSFFGSLYILSVMTIVIGLMLMLELKNQKINIGPINWIGENSILVFFAHRILMTKLIIPLYLMIGSTIGFIPKNSIFEAYFAIVIVTMICFYVKKNNVTELIIKNKSMN